MFHTCTLHSDGRPLQTQVSFRESGLLYFPKAHVYLKNPTVWFLFVIIATSDCVCPYCFTRASSLNAWTLYKLSPVCHVVLRLEFASLCRPAECAIIHVQYNMQHWRRRDWALTLCATFCVFVSSLGLHSSHSAHPGS